VWSRRWHVVELLYSVHGNGSVLSPDTDDPPDTASLIMSVESAVVSVSVFRVQEVTRQDYVYSLAVIGVVRSRELVTSSLRSAWQTSYGTSLPCVNQ